MTSRMRKKKHKDTHVQIRVSDRQKTNYERVADAQDKPTSEWVREVLDRAVEAFDDRQRKTN